MDRRDFLKMTALAGTAAALAPSVLAGTPFRPVPASEHLCVALVGCGAQGNVLLDAMMRATKSCGIQIVAVCDIWDWKLQTTARRLRANGRAVRTYRDYREMLAKEPSLDAIFVATPDCWHAPVTIAALEAGKHVYCEKMMAHTLEAAQEMLRAAAKTPLLVQIGHQRHSNPYYRWAQDKILAGGVLGGITGASGVWNRAAQKPVVAPKKFQPDLQILREFGYENIHQFLNWRGFRRYSGGPICDLGSHQIEVFNWFLGDPVSVVATGGRDFTAPENSEWQDNIHCVFEYKTARGNVRAVYSVRLHTGYGIGYHEVFMGDFGSLRLAENPNLIALNKEANTTMDWSDFVRRGIMKSSATGTAKSGEALDARAVASEPVEFFAAPDSVTLGNKTIHQPHVENFLQAIRGNAELACPIAEAFKNEAPIFAVTRALETGQKIFFNKT
ncbi:MAG: Gfo/Idh/MocA family oxidoreductase [Opitutales bacterium]|nr:Gfo/Idh/MocA family oxidoreductase [Opitutales bacterium]